MLCDPTEGEFYRSTPSGQYYKDTPILIRLRGVPQEYSTKEALQGYSNIDSTEGSPTGVLHEGKYYKGTPIFIRLRGVLQEYSIRAVLQENFNQGSTTRVLHKRNARKDVMGQKHPKRSNQ